jgi:hypothetical protein
MLAPIYLDTLCHILEDLKLDILLLQNLIPHPQSQHPLMLETKFHNHIKQQVDL